MPQRLYSVLKTCQQNTPKHIFASYSVYTTSSQRPYSVHTTFPWRLFNVHDASMARKKLLQRVHGVLTARTQHTYCVTFYDKLYYYQNALQTLSPNTGTTRRLYRVQAARPQRAHVALEDPTALPQHPNSALSNTLCKRQAAAFVLSMFKTNAAAWRTMRLHSVFTEFPQRCWELHSAHHGDLQLFGRCGNAVKTPLWCDRAFTEETRTRVFRENQRMKYSEMLYSSVTDVNFIGAMSPCSNVE